MNKIEIYDTTLRDGTQAEEINLALDDKIRVARKLDEQGLDYIEGGWPSSNPTDEEFFREISNYSLKHSKIAAFGSTHNTKTTADKDPNLNGLIAAKCPVTTIFGKTWDLHVTEALHISLERNLELVRDSLAYLKPHFEKVFFDAEHFFDGYKANAPYAIEVLKAAHGAGADVLVLCDTNGGTLPHELSEILQHIKRELPNARLGIHAHNDSECAVANSLEAVRQGASHVQGTINGFGERCGNANLCSVIPNLMVKMGEECISKEELSLLTQTAHYITELANMRPMLRQPFVGRSAFAHKGGVHVSAVLKDSRTYEHIDPASVGNIRRVLLSDLAGRSNIMFMAQKYYENMDKNDPCVQGLLAEIKERESLGYEYSAAEASFLLLFFRTMGWSKNYFQLLRFRVMNSREGEIEPYSEATVMLKVRGERIHSASDGDGPVNALDNALRKALEPSYPSLKEMKLIDFKVRVLSGYVRDTGGTASNVRVLIESGDKKDKWTTVGLSHNIIDASWQALVDSINYKLFKDDPQKWPMVTNL